MWQCDEANGDLISGEIMLAINCTLNLKISLSSAGKDYNLDSVSKANDNTPLDRSGVPQEEKVIGSLKRRPLFIISSKMTL